MNELNLGDPSSVEDSTKQKPRPVDRITLGTGEAARVQDWLSKLKDSSSGFLNITKSDIVNFLIRQHGSDLSAKEIKGIRSAHYDPIRHLNWITPRLKEAIEQNNIEKVALFQSEIRGIELSIIADVKPAPSAPLDPAKPRGRRRKSLDVETESENDVP